MDIAKFENAVAIILHSWTVLSLAVENEWGGPDSAAKRDWLGGIVAEMFQGIEY